jgi:hypothetical protein
MVVFSHGLVDDVGLSTMSHKIKIGIAMLGTFIIGYASAAFYYIQVQPSGRK